MTIYAYLSLIKSQGEKKNKKKRRRRKKGLKLWKENDPGWQIPSLKESLHLLAGRFDKRITLFTQVGCGRGAPFASENKHSFKTWLIVNQLASPTGYF